MKFVFAAENTLLSITKWHEDNESAPISELAEICIACLDVILWIFKWHEDKEIAW